MQMGALSARMAHVKHTLFISTLEDIWAQFMPEL